MRADVFPSPLIPTSLRCPVLPSPLWAETDGLNGWWVRHPQGRIGRVFPRVVADLRGDWYGRCCGAVEEAERCPASGDPLGAVRAAFAHVCDCGPSEISFEVAS
jgi:hypothetical protein